MISVIPTFLHGGGQIPIPPCRLRPLPPLTVPINNDKCEWPSSTLPIRDPITVMKIPSRGPYKVRVPVAITRHTRACTIAPSARVGLHPSIRKADHIAIVAVDTGPEHI